MPLHAPIEPPVYQTVLDPFRQGAMHAAKEGFLAEPHMFGAHRGRLFIGHVVVEWKSRLFDATGVVDDEHGVESWGMVDHTDPDYDYLTEEQALDGQLHYIDDTYPSRSAQERIIETGTRGQCPLRDIEHSLREAMK